MDIFEFVIGIIGESATGALGLFAIWSLKKLYEQRIQEREDYAARLEKINTVLVEKLEEGNIALATSTEVVRQNTAVLQSLQRLLEER